MNTSDSNVIATITKPAEMATFDPQEPSKSGAQSFRPMSRKSFALTADGAKLKGKALKRAHFAYLAKCANYEGAMVAAAIAAGHIKIVGRSTNKAKDGGSIKWMDADRFAKQDAPSARAKGLTKEQVLESFAAEHGVSVDDLLAAVEMAKQAPVNA